MRLLFVLALSLTVGQAAEPRPYLFPAELGRLDTGLWLERGERVAIQAEGSWTMWEGHYGLSNPLGHRYRVGEHGWGRLMARVGAGEPVAVGPGNEWTAAQSGILYLFPNVGDVGVRDGAGELRITVVGGRPVTEVIAEQARRGARVEVPAEGDGVFTSVYVPDGELVRINAYGEWQMFAGGPLLTAAGDASRILSSGRPWGRLVARFGGPTFSTGQVHDLGPAAELRPARGGLLHLYAEVGEFAGHPRRGSLTVVVRGGRPARPEDIARERQRAQDLERTMAFLRLHQLRTEVGLTKPLADPALMRAAQAHAEYLAHYRLTGHAEDPQLQGYTGATPAERAAREGFGGQVAGEMIHGYVDGIQAIDGLWLTVNQRLGLIDPRAISFGIGIASDLRQACVVLVGLPGNLAPTAERLPPLATYPRDNQVHLPTTWSGIEIPVALPEEATRPVGTPISVTVNEGTLLQMVSFALLDGRGAGVPVWLILPPADRQPGGESSLFLVPQRPLKPFENYRAKVELTTSAGPREHEWRFTTGEVTTPLLTRPTLADPTNPEVDLGRAEPIPLGPLPPG